MCRVLYRVLSIGSLALCLLVFGTGCGIQPQPLIPTVAILPSAAPSHTPRPTFTGLPTATPTITETASMTVTATHSPIPTRTVVITRTASPTTSSTLTPSAIRPVTATAAPSQTPGTPGSPSPSQPPGNQNGVIGETTPTGPPRILAPLITVFKADAIAGQVTLTWAAEADVLTLTETTGSGTPVDAIGVANSGQQKFPLDQRYGASISFQLVADRNGQSMTRTLTIPIGCPIDWFFTPAPPGCPLQPVQISDGEYQPFQRGVGFYVAATNTVYLLSYAGGLVTAYPLGDHYTTPVPLTIPKGFSASAGHIGAIWQSGRWPDSQSLRQLFGWALNPPQMYRVSIELKAPTDLYLSGPANTIYELNLADGSNWSIVIGVH